MDYASSKTVKMPLRSPIQFSAPSITRNLAVLICAKCNPALVRYDVLIGQFMSVRVAWVEQGLIKVVQARDDVLHGKVIVCIFITWRIARGDALNLLALFLCSEKLD